MLATLVRKPFNRKGWLYEEKYDGYRIVAYKEGDTVQLLSRNSIDRTERFSPVAAAIQKLPSRTLLLDGEVVVFDRKRVSRFQLLQQGKSEFVYAVFDCLYQNGKSFMREPLSSRRPTMEAAIAAHSSSVLIPSGHTRCRWSSGLSRCKTKGFRRISGQRFGFALRGRAFQQVAEG